jgi:hypothetical protein
LSLEENAIPIGLAAAALVGALARDRLTPLDLAVAREKPPVGC